MRNIIKITKEHIQKNEARLLKEAQEEKASTLQSGQKQRAKELREKDASLPSPAVHAARQVLELEQKAAADELKSSQHKAADVLAAVHEKANKAASESEQALRFALGGYSVDSNKE